MKNEPETLKSKYEIDADDGQAPQVRFDGHPKSPESPVKVQQGHTKIKRRPSEQHAAQKIQVQ